MKGFDIELSVSLSETDKKTISKALNNVYERGYSKALHEVWVKAIGKVDECLSLEELNEILEELNVVHK